MLQASALTKSYGHLQVLRGVSLEVKQGEILGIVGASGAGKSTLLQLLGTLDLPDCGTVSLNGQDLNKLKPAALAQLRNQQLGFVFQFHNLLPEFTALENVCMPALISGKSMKEASVAAAELLKLLGLTDRASHKPKALSGGEQQRVAVARALINKPAIVFADEPSGNLDSQNAKALHQLFFDLRRDLGQTFVIVTHNQELAALADRCLVMRDGLVAEMLVQTPIYAGPPPLTSSSADE